LFFPPGQVWAVKVVVNVPCLLVVTVTEFVLSHGFWGAIQFLCPHSSTVSEVEGANPLPTRFVVVFTIRLLGCAVM
jgi:hypothetical protein